MTRRRIRSGRATAFVSRVIGQASDLRRTIGRAPMGSFSTSQLYVANGELSWP
jgi:hypothetical protein